MFSGQVNLIRGGSSQCKLESMPNLAMHTGCLAKCQGHLGKSWSGQKLQMVDSLDVQEGGEVSWSNAQTC